MLPPVSCRPAAEDAQDGRCESCRKCADTTGGGITADCGHHPDGDGNQRDERGDRDQQETCASVAVELQQDESKRWEDHEEQPIERADQRQGDGDGMRTKAPPSIERNLRTSTECVARGHGVAEGRRDLRRGECAPEPESGECRLQGRREREDVDHGEAHEQRDVPCGELPELLDNAAVGRDLWQDNEERTRDDQHAEGADDDVGRLDARHADRVRVPPPILCRGGA